MSEPTGSQPTLPRRALLGGAAAALSSGVGWSGPARQDSSQQGGRALVSAGDTVLFQGDSITDAGRSREDQGANEQVALGSGYAWLACAGLQVARPGDALQVFNRGISGNKVFELAERWEADCLELEPDLVSILIGVNDIWHTKGGGYDGTVEVYERDYAALLERTRAALPGVHLVVCEPFVLRCGAVDDSWFPEFDEYRAAARRVAEANAAVWVGFQEMFDRLVDFAPPAHWAADGVHPSSAGAALMAQTWLRAVGAC